VVGGAASAAIAAALAAPPSPATIVGVFGYGAYLLLSGHQVLALLTPEAARLPNAVVTAGLDADALRPGDRAWVGELRVRALGLEVRVVRWWRPRQVRRACSLAAAQSGAAALASGLSAHGAWPAPDPVRQAAARLGQAAAAGRHLTVRSAAAGLVGLGPGLTPAGDDVLTGYLLGLRALAGVSPSAERLRASAGAGARDARWRTTALAATLVRHADLGEAADVAADLMDALVDGAPIDRPLRTLVGTGHTSGRDLAEGLLLAWGIAGRIAGMTR
jgi:hypothetical protein